MLFFLFISATGTAQSDDSKFLPNIVPPSPTAGELGKFGNVPVGLFTGAANISVPLITFKTKDLESPISLFYGSNGIKVDEVASNVGLGWNMNFGGVITRTVRDKNDETQTTVYPPDDLSNATDEQKVQFYKAAGQDNADTESDIYSFNFNGNSGKFIYDKNGVPVLVNNQKIKIERTGINNADFILTATNGVKYYFTEKETTTFRSSGAGHSIPVGSVTAWYLSKMTHPNGSEIYLTYENYTMNYVASNSQSLIMSYPPIQEDCWKVVYAKAPTLSGIISQNMTVIGKRINKIFSKNMTDGYVTFSYYSQGIYDEVIGDNKIENITLYNKENIEIEKIKFDYLKTANQRVFLQNITFLDPSKKYTFEYINQTEFPQRLSYSQDHWGYFNGKNNINLVPKNITGYNLDLNNIDYNGADKEPDKNYAKIGLLNNIIYPTKGYTEFDYESNTYWGEKTTYPTKTILNLERSPEDHNPTGSTYTITSPINQRIEFLGRVNYVSNQAPQYDENGNLIPDPSNTGHFSAAMQISSTDAPGVFLPFYELTQFGVPYPHQSSFTFINSTESQIVDNVFYFDAEAGKSYTLVLYKNGIRAAARVDVSYYATAPVTVNTNIETGGVRIKSTKDFATEGAVPVYKRYYYANKEDINHSSGDNGKTPLYLDIATQRKTCSSSDGMVLCLYTTLYDLVVSSSSMISLFDTGSSNCFYKYVTVSEGGDFFENGGEMKEFTVDRDGAGQIVLGDTEIKSAPLTNFGWDNGLERKSQIFQKKKPGSEFVIVAENENKYKLDLSYNKEITAYSVRKNYEEPCPLSQSVQNFSIVEYKTKGYWFYLESSIAKKYDLKGLNPIETTTTYQYNNPVHIQLTSQSTESSLQETLQTIYYYPQDASLVSEPFVNDMITANRIDTPLRTETFKGGVKLSEQKTQYAKDDTTANLLLPKFIYAAKFPNSLSTGNGLKRKITYDKYDEMGNILQYTPEAGLPVSVIWGYNKTQPIAKIENTVYDNIPVGTITNLQTLSDADKDNCLGESCSEQRLRNELNVLRNSLLGSFVTTYTYNPLVGVTSVTDLKGMTSYYEYDTVGRLKFVKDNELNVLQKYCYNYKGQQTDCSDNTSTTVILYKSIARSGLFTKNNCAVGGTGTSINYTQEIGAVNSDISQADADNKGLIKFNADGQAFANDTANCTFWNVAKSQIIMRNNCVAGGTPDSASYTVPAGRYFSNLSQADADAQAQAEINTNGQAYANANAKCTFWN
ncbi:DUF5977 domain-containing protein, partial [Flavobacterium chryseum]|uniref:DUF5977 domain-containing protein n=1 Tax=Flavobacterium sp. P3160 TaxID=2512113 RepID=UPI001AAD7B2E